MQTGAETLEMLVIGRVILGLGIGLSQQSMPLFLTESAPFNLRGSMFITNQLASATGNFAAQMINYKMKNYAVSPGENGWRISLGLAGEREGGEGGQGDSLSIEQVGELGQHRHKLSVRFTIHTYATPDPTLIFTLTAVPALIFTIGICCISDTPNSLVERGQLEAARTTLVRYRGVSSSWMAVRGRRWSGTAG